MRRFGLVDFLLLALVLLTAGGVRAYYLMAYADSGKAAGPLLVQDRQEPTPGESESDQDRLIQNIKATSDFKGPAPLSRGEEETAHASPGYPWLVGLLAKALPDAAQLQLTVRWAQCGLGALTAMLYFLFARRAFRSPAVGLLAGLLCALHPFWVVDTAAIDDGVLASFALALALFFGARANQTAGPFASLIYGLALAGAALVRAALLPFAFVALCWFLWRSRSLTRGWLCGLLALLGFVNGLVPWTIRNWQVFHEPVPVVDSVPVHMWMGNNPKADGGPVSFEDPEALPPDRREILKNYEIQTHRYYLELDKDTQANITADPPAVAQHRLQALESFVVGERGVKYQALVDNTEAPKDPRSVVGLIAGPIAADPVPKPTPAPAAGSPAWTYQGVFQWTALGMFLLGLLGWRWSYGWRKESMPASLAVIWIPLPYIVSHAEFLSGPRLPLDGVLLCYAAFALLALIPVVGRRLRDGAKAVPAGALPPEEHHP
jgi:4-amino-4-deoxy-L-arabinose transferase-like glycosyltransferase